MKIYTYLKIDMSTNEVLEEESFEYDGPIAHCGGGGETSTSYDPSPWAQQVYNKSWNAFSQGMERAQADQPLWDTLPTPNAPQAPSAAGIYSGVQQYNIPNTVAPTQGWYNSISPEVQRGLWEPYNQGAKQLMETLGGQGSLGNARGGYTGAAGAALGKYYSDASTNIGTQAWNMMQPGMMANWNAELNKNMGARNEYQQENLQNYNQELLRHEREWQNAMNIWNSQQGALQAGRQNAMQIVPSVASGVPGVVSQPTNWLGAIGSGLTGAGTGYMGAQSAGMGGGQSASLAGLFGLGSFMGGK